MKIMKQHLGPIITFLVTLSCCISAHASLGLLETAEIVPSGFFKVGIAPQLYLGNGGGVDASAFLDLNINSDTIARVQVGSGATDFWAAASVKWVPYPDYENQPAIGLRGQVAHLRESTTSFYSFQVTPIISKKYSTEKGLFIPYVGVPLTVIYQNSTTNFTVTKFAIGSEWVITEAVQAGAEFGADLSNNKGYTFAASTLAVYFSFQFDEKMGFKK